GAMDPRATHGQARPAARAASGQPHPAGPWRLGARRARCARSFPRASGAQHGWPSKRRRIGSRPPFGRTPPGAVHLPAEISDPVATAPGPVGILVKTWPKLSETFILEEVLGLERLGRRLHIFALGAPADAVDRKSTRLNSSHTVISY